MRNFAFDKDRPETSAADFAGMQPDLEPPAEILGLDETARETLRDDARSAFRESDIEDEESGNNTAKIAGAVLVGLLLIGGSIYAYESTVADHAPKTVAMLPPAPQHNATADQAVTPPVTTPETGNTSSATTAPPAVSTPKPARGRASAAPVPAEEPTPSAPAMAPATSASADPAINQPMTLTPQTAPLPQQSAMQQPITAPDVSGQSAQPTPEVANNASGAATVQPDLTPPAPSGTSPAFPPATPAQ